MKKKRKSFLISKNFSNTGIFNKVENGSLQNF